MTTPIKPIGWVTTLTTITKDIKEMYSTVMTIENSPLKNLDPRVAHMVFQCLAFVWSGLFAAMIGSYMAFGISAFFHICLITGVFLTAITFRQAEQNKKAFNLRPGYHSVSRTRHNLWINGQKVELDDKDPGGEHE